MEIIAIPLTLIAMLGALFLLAKAQKDALHDIFKYASYFVLTLCVFTLTMVLIHAFDHKKGKKMMKIMRGGECEMMGNEGCGPGKGNKMYHYNMHDNGSCPMMKKGDCCEGDERGNVKSEKEIIINKDTIVVK